MRTVLEHVNPRLQQDAERTLNSGGTVQFGSLWLSSVGVIWRAKDPIPYNTIVKCEIDGAFLRIKAEGKWLDNVAASVKKIPNIFVALDLIAQKRASFGQKAAAATAGSSAIRYL